MAGRGEVLVVPVPAGGGHQPVQRTSGLRGKGREGHMVLDASLLQNWWKAENMSPSCQMSLCILLVFQAPSLYSLYPNLGILTGRDLRQWFVSSFYNKEMEKEKGNCLALWSYC